MKTDYQIRIQKVNEGKGHNFWTVTCIEIPELYVEASSAEEGLIIADKEILRLLKWYKENNKKIPESIKNRKHSGQLRVRMPVELHEKLDELASENKTSLNQYIVSKLSEVKGNR
jgi:hypothetical protein